MIAELIANGYEVLGLDIGKLAYVVPHFEEVALKRVKRFGSIPWRRADLLHVKKPRMQNPWQFQNSKRSQFGGSLEAPHEFRVFIRDRRSLDAPVIVERLDTYSSNVSTRAHTRKSHRICGPPKSSALVSVGSIRS